ncbi:MAG: hypothetical protein ACREQ2_27605 [Candidatus Binatia bacterium]
MLGLVAADLVLHGVNSLPPLQTFDLLLLAYRIGLPLDSIYLLIGLQALELLIVPLLIELALRFRRWWLLRPRRLGFLLLDLIQSAL